MPLGPPQEAQWRALVDMLPDWLGRLRHPAQFWPQFRALVREIESNCSPEEREEVRQRTRALLAHHTLVAPAEWALDDVERDRAVQGGNDDGGERSPACGVRDPRRQAGA